MRIKPAGLFGQFMIVAFWFMAVAWAPTALTVSYLAATILVLYLLSRAKNIVFRDLIGNNNWVFCAALSMTIITMWIAIENPYVPPTLLDMLKDAPVDPLADESTFGRANQFVFGETLTDGWRNAAWVYAALTLLAIPVSFADDLSDRLAEDGETVGSVLRTLLRRS